MISFNPQNNSMRQVLLLCLVSFHRWGNRVRYRDKQFVPDFTASTGQPGLDPPKLVPETRLLTTVLYCFSTSPRPERSTSTSLFVVLPLFYDSSVLPSRWSHNFSLSPVPTLTFSLFLLLGLNSMARHHTCALAHVLCPLFHSVSLRG